MASKLVVETTLLGALLVSIATALAQKNPDGDTRDTSLPAEDRATELAKQEQNPLTRLIRVQLEENAQFGFGPDNGVLNILRIQPLIPFKLNEKWHLITRTVIPIIHSPWPESTDGLSDIALQLFLSPDKTGNFIWGVGPAFSIPSATDEMIGTEKWSAGPAVAGIYTGGPWVAGALVGNLWSIAGNSRRQNVNVMTLRPIINYNLPKGWYLSSSPSIVANWEADNDNRWLIPLGGGMGKVFAIGTQRMSALMEAYHHVKSPQIGPDWQLRFQIQLLLPK